MSTLLFDIETDGLLGAMTKLWCIQLGDADGEDATVYSDHALPDGTTFPPISEALERMRAAEVLVAHNGIGFDLPAMHRFHPGIVTYANMLDTLVLSRLADPEERNHTLKAWGVRTGTHKGDYKGDFQTFDAELVDYARQDIPTLRALWRKVWPKVQPWTDAVRLEHEVARIIWQQENNGFVLDIPAAEKLAADLAGEIAECEVALRRTFKPEWIKSEPEVTVPKASSKKFGFTKGVPYQKVEYREFNPGSRQQAGERLMRLGWKPKKFGASGAPRVDETSLAGLKHPAAALLVRYYRAQKLLGQVSDGATGWLKLVEKSGRVHGRVNPNGACTGRMSHFKPNMAQVSKDKRARSAWRARPGWKLVGCDAEGLEARMLGHYLARYDGGAFSDRVVNGDKKLGTDVHTMNLKAAQTIGLQSRDGAKTLLYALMYGAGDFKLGQTVIEDARANGKPLSKGNGKDLGALARKALAKAMVGIDKLTDACKARAKQRGFLVGIDGRHIPIRSEHSALNTLLQGGGAIVMKKALVLFDHAARERGWRCGGGLAVQFGTEDFGYCANVHDEVQMEVREGIAADLGALFAKCIEDAGEALGVRCPLAGDSSVGECWADTH